MPWAAPVMTATFCDPGMDISLLSGCELASFVELKAGGCFDRRGDGEQFGEVDVRGFVIACACRCFGCAVQGPEAVGLVGQCGLVLVKSFRWLVELKQEIAKQLAGR